MEEPVTIVDRSVLKILSVDTRMDILKLLSEGGRTPSFISKKLNKSDATIVEHLQALVKAGLVKKVEQPGKKWIFYTLTEKGEGIVSKSSSRKLVIILVSTLLVFTVGGFVSLSYFYGSGSFTSKTYQQPVISEQVGEKVSNLDFEIRMEGYPAEGQNFRLTVRIIAKSDFGGQPIFVRMILPNSLIRMAGQVEWTGQMRPENPVEFSAYLKAVRGDTHYISIVGLVSDQATFIKDVLVTTEGIRTLRTSIPIPASR